MTLNVFHWKHWSKMHIYLARVVNKQQFYTKQNQSYFCYRDITKKKEKEVIKILPISYLLLPSCSRNPHCLPRFTTPRYIILSIKLPSSIKSRTILTMQPPPDTHTPIYILQSQCNSFSDCHGYLTPVWERSMLWGLCLCVGVYEGGSLYF